LGWSSSRVPKQLNVGRLGVRSRDATSLARERLGQQLQLPSTLLDQPLQILVGRRRAGTDLFAVDEEGVGDAPFEEGRSIGRVNLVENDALVTAPGRSLRAIAEQVLQLKREGFPCRCLDYSIL
jgi:hypothetical protein